MDARRDKRRKASFSLRSHKGLTLAAVGALAVGRQRVPTLVNELAAAGNLVEHLLPVVARVGHKVLVAAKVVVTCTALLWHLDSLFFKTEYDRSSHRILHSV